MFKYLRIRKAKNGYIFKKRTLILSDNTAVAESENDYEYELVKDEELNEKFGEAFSPSSISGEDGEVVVCMHFCNAKIFDKKGYEEKESEMLARQKHAMYQHEKYTPNTILVIEYKEEKNSFYECYDDDAERMHSISNQAIMKKDGVRYLWMDNSSESRRTIGESNAVVLTTTRAKVLEWYNGTKIEK